MTEERKKRFYPKRGDYVVSTDKVSFEPVSRGRKEINDSKWTDEAIEGIKTGAFKNATQAALTIAVRNGGSDNIITKNRRRIARKTKELLRSQSS